MDEIKDIRWVQRFSNFKKALKTLKSAVNLSNQRELSDLEKQGLIQAFEFTHELFWKTVKDFLSNQGNQTIYGSKDATREAFNLGLIDQGEDWMKMIESRNLSTHTYDQEISELIVEKTKQSYIHLFTAFENKMEEIKNQAT